MSYSDFSLSSVKKAFQLNLIEKADLFADCAELQPSLLLRETLKENLSLALASNTEKSRSEMLIAPILIDLRRQYSNHIGIFSGINFTVDPVQGLNGNCDFLISYSDDLLLITAPIITLVEAKKEDLNGGLGQCIAEMIAAQYFNLKLSDRNVWIDLTEYYLDNLPKILGVLAQSIPSNIIS